ncbi:hypothetical protein GF389_00415 [Candidatus Dojkabacteria bacterium]|nr:hypothetical protein [Candidatus Dojkabacteria bacterium]
MNTNIEIVAKGDSGTSSDAALEETVEKALDQFDYVVKKFSRFEENSELNTLNKNSSRHFIVSEELFTLVRLAIQASKESEYLYDPTIIDLLKAYGYGKSYDPSNIIQKLEDPNFQKELEKIIQSRPSPEEIELSEKDLSIKLAKGQKLDLGSIAKGYAIDLAAKTLENEGYKDFLINAGGDIYAGEEKKIALFDPRNPEEPLGEVHVKNQALAGSGDFARKIGIFSHLVNTRPRRENSKILQTYVIAPTATEADLYSTVLSLMGKPGLKLLEKKKYRSLIIGNDSIKGRITPID